MAILKAESMASDICAFCSFDDPEKILWVQCDHCPQWVHVNCVPLPCVEDENSLPVNVLPTSSKQIIGFSCDKHGNTALKIKGKSSKRRLTQDLQHNAEGRMGLRKKMNIDYIALNEGQDKRLKSVHPHVKAFMECFKKWENTTNIIASSDLASNFNEITVPLKVKDPQHSGMKVPSAEELGITTKFKDDAITVETVMQVLGQEYSVEVMDVQTQQNSNWSMFQWNDYFTNTPIEERDRIYNVISLEVSHVKEFASGIRRPDTVEANDLVNIVWNNIKDDSPTPKVTKYILMSVQNAFTDFHLDFAGTSVYYKVVSGAKKFILFPPTEHNLSKYRDWCKSDDQHLIFLGDQLQDGIAMDLRQGDLFMIPCGYIHVVYTPLDSVVVGGNFLTLRDLTTQLRIVDIERLTKVPKRFTFPYFETVMGKTLEWILKNQKIPEIPEDQLEALVRYMEDPKIKYKPVNFHNKKALLNEIEKRLL